MNLYEIQETTRGRCHQCGTPAYTNNPHPIIIRKEVNSRVQNSIDEYPGLVVTTVKKQMCYLCLGLSMVW